MPVCLPFDFSEGEVQQQRLRSLIGQNAEWLRRNNIKWARAPSRAPAKIAIATPGLRVSIRERCSSHRRTSLLRQRQLKSGRSRSRNAPRRAPCSRRVHVRSAVQFRGAPEGRRFPSPLRLRPDSHVTPRLTPAKRASRPSAPKPDELRPGRIFQPFSAESNEIRTAVIKLAPSGNSANVRTVRVLHQKARIL